MQNKTSDAWLGLAQRCRWLHCLSLLGIICAANTARAGTRGEASLQVFANNEMAWPHHPAAPDKAADAVYLPRVGMQLNYGLFNWLEAAVGCDATWPRDVIARNTSYQGMQGGDLYARYLDVFLPLSLSARLNRGQDFSVVVSGAWGWVYSYWAPHLMLPTGKSETDALTSAYPLQTSSPWFLDTFIRAEVAGEWRPTDWLALRFGPNATRKTSGGLHLGLVARADFVWGLGSF